MSYLVGVSVSYKVGTNAWSKATQQKSQCMLRPAATCLRPADLCSGVGPEELAKRG